MNIQLGRGRCPAYGLRSSAQYLVAFVPNEFVVPAEEAVVKLHTHTGMVVIPAQAGIHGTAAQPVQGRQDVETASRMRDLQHGGSRLSPG